MTWITENLSTIIISLVLLGIVCAITIKMIRDKRRGKCCSGCSCCPLKEQCHK